MTEPRTPACAEWLLPAVLSATAGAVDVIGFLSLGGLFTAHITGDLVVLAAHFVTGRFSETGPLFAVPVFVCVLAAITLVFGTRRDVREARRVLLSLEAILLGGQFAAAATLGPFAAPERAAAVFTGMLGVAAMATQSALVRLALPGSPATNVFTTNTTQLAIDLATLACGRGESAQRVQARRRSGALAACIAGFVFGCATGAALEMRWGLAAFAIPVFLAVLAVPLGELRRDPAPGNAEDRKLSIRQERTQQL